MCSFARVPEIFSALRLSKKETWRFSLDDDRAEKVQDGQEAEEDRARFKGIKVLWQDGKACLLLALAAAVVGVSRLEQWWG